MTKKSIDQAKIELLPISELLPYPKNPRTHPKANVDKLAQSLTEYGWTNPVLVTDKLEVVAGHGRLLAAKQLKITSAPCIRLKHLSEAQVRAYRLADNRLGLDSDWDLELLASELRELDLDNLLTGFDPDELERILNSNAGREGEDARPQLEETAVSVPGEIWALGAHRLLCGDACDPQAVQSLLAGVTPSVMVTDPPYGVQYDAGWRIKHNAKPKFGFDGKRPNAVAKVDNDDQADWTDAWALFKGAIAYVWHSGMHGLITQSSLECAEFKIRAQIIWVKQKFPMSRGDYHWQHESCWYAVRGTGHWCGDRKQTTVWHIDNNHPVGHHGPMEEKLGHSAQKPVECMRRPIVNHTSSGQAVYDPFMGSGTTIIAAETIGRVCYGVEINPLYVDMAIRRWQTFTGKTATRLGDGKAFG